MNQSPLSVGLVACCLNTPHVRGMGRYLFDLLSESRDFPSLAWTLYGNDPSLPIFAPEGVAARKQVFPFRGDRFYLWDQIGLPRQARASGVDLLHCTEGVLPYWQPLPTVVTLHDTIAFEERPSTPYETFYWDRLIPAALARCAHVITISHASKASIVARWPALAEKTTVIYHGIDQAYLAEAPIVPSAAITTLMETFAGAPYMVYLGGPSPRKRFQWALEVLAHARHPELKLVACGFSASTHAQVLQNIPAELRERVILAPYLSDDDLRALYRKALAVLYPTLFEGFGFPALEAQASGTPVLMSPLGSLQELAGPLAMMLPPHDREAWVSAVQRLLLEPAWRQHQAPLAREWAQGFSWRRSFEQHLAVYQQVQAQSRSLQGRRS